MKLSSQRFGELEIRDDKIITFPDGLIGLPDLKKFAILEHDGDAPLHWLLSLDEPEIAFIIIDPTVFLGEYKVELSKLDVEKLQLEDDTETAIFTLVVIPDNPEEMTANTKGPLVINVPAMLGRQVIQDNPAYHIKHRILGAKTVAKEKQSAKKAQPEANQLARAAL